jgi:hypothetical protein
MTALGRTRAALALLLAPLLVSIAAAPAAADTVVGTSGVFGASALRERYVDATHYQAGAQCVYDDGGGMHAVAVRPPSVLARSTSAAEDFGVVGWRARLQKRQPSGSYATISTSGVERQTASDASSAGFSGTAFEAGPPSGFAAGAYRVLVDEYWFSASATESPGTGTQIGRVTRRVDVYQLRGISIGPGGDSFSSRLGNCRANP